MAAIRAGDLARFLASGWKTYRIFLVYGTDEGLVRETAARLAANAAGGAPDPLSLVALEGDQIAQDPGLLADELRAFSMFGGTRVVQVRNAGRCPAPAIAAALAEPPDQAVLILEAGELKGSSTLRSAIEKSPVAAAIPCFADSAQIVHRLIDDSLRTHGSSITPEARDMLAHALGGDRALSRGELEKLLLYAGERRTIDAAMVADIVSDAGRLEIGTLVDLAFAGHIREIETEANRFFAAGTHPAAILSQAIGHVLLLRRALRSGNVDGTAKQARLHFSREPAFRRACTLWTEPRLERALRLLSDAVLQGRRSARLAETLTVRTLWAVTRLSGSAADGA